MNLTLNQNTLKELIQPDLKIVVLEEVDSTNNYARQIHEPSLIVSSFQSAGRGRYDRSFYSPKDSGVYFSLVLTNQQLSSQLFTITMALAVTEVLVQTKIKWLNDIILNNGKLGGILCEGTLMGKSYSRMIIGVGLNLNLKDVPCELESIVASYHEVETEFDVNQIVSSIINRFMVLNELGVKEIIQLYKNRCITLNQKVVIDNLDYQAIDINSEGHLVCLDKNNNHLVFNNQEVSIHVE